MKAQVKGPVVAIAVLAALGIVVFLGMKTMGGGEGLDHGQIKYTPGKPPWLETDPSKKGPGGSPPASGTGAPSIGANAPVAPPVIDNGKSTK